jgi:hypothetical protein
MRLTLDLVSGFTCGVIAEWARGSLLPETVVLSDELACCAGVTEAGCAHKPVVLGLVKPRDPAGFKWINTLMGNLESTLAGDFKVLEFRKSAQTCLASFASRLNHRFDPRGLSATLIVDVLRTRPIPK